MGDLKLKLRHGLLSGLLVCLGPVLAQDAVVSKEATARAASAEEAYAFIEEGDAAYLDGDFETAVDRYASALARLPDGAPAVADLRAMAVQRYGQTALVRAQNLMRVGDKKAASALLTRVESVDPDHPKVKQFRAKMDDPIRNNPALTPEHAANVDRVRRLLYEAEGFYDLGQFDRAYLIYEDILRIDPYNKTARRGMERVSKAKTDYSASARDQARAGAMAQVSSEWENKVPKRQQLPIVGGELGGSEGGLSNIEEKLNTIMVDELRLNGATLEEAVEFLRLVSTREDTQTLDESKRGVPFVVQLGDEDLPVVKKIRSARIQLALDNIPLREAVRRVAEASGTVHRVDDFAVVFNARGFDNPVLVRRQFRVPPDFLTSGTVNQDGGDNDPFADPADDGGGLVAKKLSAEERLKAYDVNFPDDAWARYNKGNNILTVYNTAANLRLVGAIVSELAKNEPLIVKIKTTFVDISQQNLEDLGFDFMMGKLDVGAYGVLSGGTTGTGGELSDMIAGNPVTAGNRSGGLVPNTDGLDALLNRDRSSPPGGDPNDAGGNSSVDLRRPTAGDGTSSRAPGILSLSGVIDDTAYQLLMRGLSQKKGKDVMAQPEVVTRPGQNATVESVIEFPYPDDFEPPQIPNVVAGGGGIVTPATPTDFKTRKLGVMLEVLPQVGPNREVIEVALNPAVTDFEGFINYGTPIFGSTNATTINPVAGTVGGSSAFGELTPNAILKPLFRTTRGNTTVRILDGQTIVMGGLVSEIRRTINDSVPVLGDIPMVGRLFRQDAISVEKRSILIFVTVELTDAAGNPYRER